MSENQKRSSSRNRQKESKWFRRQSPSGIESAGRCRRDEPGAEKDTRVRAMRHGQGLTGSSVVSSGMVRTGRRPKNGSGLAVSSITRSAATNKLPKLPTHRSNRRRSSADKDPEEPSSTCPYWQARDTEPERQSRTRHRSWSATRMRSSSRTRQFFSRDAPEEIDYNAKAVKLGAQGSFFKCNDERKRLMIQLRIDAMEHGMIGGMCVVHFLISLAIERGDANLLDTVFELHFRSSATKDPAVLVEHNDLERTGDSAAVHHTAEKSRSLSLVLGYDKFNLEQKGEYRKTCEWDVDDQYRIEMTNASDHLHVRLCRPGETKHIKPPTKILVHAAIACPRGQGLDVAGKVLVKKPENIEAAGEWRKVDLDKLRPSKTEHLPLPEDDFGVDCTIAVEKKNLEKYRTIMHILDRTLGSKDPTTEWCGDALAKHMRDEIAVEEERREELEERKRASGNRQEEARKTAKERSNSMAKDDK
ncbi:hypothetical protein GE09DRAFT_1079402 [Coniochaeta sp. 2T2.1]|nr:hypothetical protein GE09DRAFT_1079402 [Coniochaeta sp. 2T2.1]